MLLRKAKWYKNEFFLLVTEHRSFEVTFFIIIHHESVLYLIEYDILMRQLLLKLANEKFKKFLTQNV